jgi:hypothetical protein
LSLARGRLERAERELEQKVRRLPFLEGYERVVRCVFAAQTSNLTKRRRVISARKVFRALR